ncbi:LD-carboxypeptidase [Enterobacteriaceae bacterium ML5]|nr:LD-carboxypeptidase [Enterobacteriaceae bacterium ML5]
MLVHLISSSTAYNEILVPDMIRIFISRGYQVDTQYLNQNRSELGYVDSDAGRAANLVAALCDKRVKLLWFVNGGGGAINLLPYLKEAHSDLLRTNPKIIIGLSDVTALHHFVNRFLDWKSIHGVMATFNAEMHAVTGYKPNCCSSIDTVFDVMSEGNVYRGILCLNKTPLCDLHGKLAGGNLTLFQSLFSTYYEKYFESDILILEDVNLTHRQFDRILNQIAFKSDFKPKAMIFGQFFKIGVDDAERLIYKRVIELFAEKVSYPVFYYPYFGHGEKNQPLILNHDVIISSEALENTYCLCQSPLQM